MSKFHNFATRKKTTWIRIVAMVITGLALCSQNSFGQEYESELLESDSSWGLFWSKARAIRYGSALTHCTRLYQRHIPVCPPVCHPSFGYHNPCWRPIPVDRRCQPCGVFHDGWTTELLPIVPLPSPTAVEPPPAPKVDLPAPSVPK